MRMVHPLLPDNNRFDMALGTERVGTSRELIDLIPDNTRRLEYWLALMGIAWGIGIAIPGHGNSAQAYQALEEIAPFWAWGVFMWLLAGARLMGLTVPGLKWLRQSAAAVSIAFYTMMSVSMWLAQPAGPASLVAIVFCAANFDILMLLARRVHLYGSPPNGDADSLLVVDRGLERERSAG